MSKGQAWNAYNEALRKLDREYEDAVKPMREKLSVKIAETEREFDDKINPLIVQKKNEVDDLKKLFTCAVMDCEQKRRELQAQARSVLNAELDKKQEPVEA